MNKKLFHKLELAGVFFTFIFGCILQFVYRYASDEPLSLVFASVNGSIWEQSKVFALPYLIWAVITLSTARPRFKQFFVAKIIGIYTMTCGNILASSLIYGIIGKRFKLIEILINIIFVLLAYVLSSRLAYNAKLSGWFVTSLFALALFLASYLCFTYSPPSAVIFYDENLNVYGIPVSCYYGDYFLDSVSAIS
ncbi:MAG: DUF6512 family protein [Clostridia bacterium]|nr:DUF6512 family protein [Clostridia bacterium]